MAVGLEAPVSVLMPVSQPELPQSPLFDRDREKKGERMGEAESIRFQDPRGPKPLYE